MEERTIVSLDYAMKYMLRDKANFGILSGFLTELLNKKVTVDAILESESNKDDPDGKTNRLDLKARIDDGEIAVFEIQFHQLVDFFGKVLFGVSRAIVEQVASGNPYDIKKVYSVNIAYYDLGAEREYLFSARLDGFRGLHFENERISFAQAPISGKGPKTDIHPEYYLILPKMFDGQLRGRFDEWIYVLQNSAVRENFTAEGIAEAAEKLNYLKMTAAEKAVYDRFKDNRSDLDNVALTAEMKGRAEGKAEGKAEVARNLKKLGLPTAQIAEATGLTPEEIEKV